MSSRQGDFLLAARDTDPGRDDTAVPYRAVRDMVVASNAQRALVVIDACYGGRATEVMGPWMEPW